MSTQPSPIRVEIKVAKPVDSVWKLWTNVNHIANWNIPFDTWHTPKIDNDLKAGGKFFFRMESKDGSEGFDHSGTYDKIIRNQRIEYTVSDGRKSIIEFIAVGDTTTIIETFEPEKETPRELQREFCTSVLKRFKYYAEAQTNI